MKICLLIFINVFFVSRVCGKKDSTFFFNEFSLSVNQTNLTNDRANDRFGFGGGIYRSLTTKKKNNLVFGFEFNRSSQFVKEMYVGHYGYSTDLTYYINCLSVPLTLGLNFGNKTKFIIEPGIFMDLSLGAKRKGTMHDYSPNQNNQPTYKEYNFSQGVGISNPNFGPSLGIGLKIPISKQELIIRTDYKLGLRELSGEVDQIYNCYLRLMIGLKI